MSKEALQHPPAFLTDPHADGSGSTQAFEGMHGPNRQAYTPGGSCAQGKGFTLPAVPNHGSLKPDNDGQMKNS